MSTSTLHLVRLVPPSFLRSEYPSHTALEPTVKHRSLDKSDLLIPKMLDIGKNEGPKPHCLVTSTKLSNFIDHTRPPTKKKPFSTIQNQEYSHTLTLLLPLACAKTFQEQQASSSKTSAAAGSLKYAHLNLKLEEILTGTFFQSFIKAPGSNLLLRSEGRAGIDNLFTLSNGVLRLEVDKPTFERLGLGGKLIPSEGRRHVKARYAVEINLRKPSMVAGKKGFERVLWAAKNVLVERVAWLMVDVRGFNKGEDLGLEVAGLLKDFAPVVRDGGADVLNIEGALVPVWPQEGLGEEEYAEAEEMLEWISMAMAGVTRVRKDDNVDPYLCRYGVTANHGEAKEQDLVCFRWRGLIHPAFAQKIFLAALKASGQGWFALNCAGFDDEGYTTLIHSDHSITWEYRR